MKKKLHAARRGELHETIFVNLQQQEKCSSKHQFVLALRNWLGIAKSKIFHANYSWSESPTPVCIPYSNMLLRPAQPEDAMAVARVHVRSWQAAYRNIFPGDYLDSLRPEDRAAKYDFASGDRLKPHTIVAVEDGLNEAIHGFATTMPVTDSDMPGYGELCALYVDPQQWGKGLGVALVSCARAQMFEYGFRKAILWVLTGNVCAENPTPIWMNDPIAPPSNQQYCTGGLIGILRKDRPERERRFFSPFPGTLESEPKDGLAFQLFERSCLALQEHETGCAHVFQTIPPNRYRNPRSSSKLQHVSFSRPCISWKVYACRTEVGPSWRDSLLGSMNLCT